ncbi:MAG: hypothetical protein ABJE95_33200 [Byssovorax sp.]
MKFSRDEKRKQKNMPINIRVQIDLSPRQKRIIRTAVVAGAVIGAFGVGVAVAAPKKFMSGQPIVAADMNANFGELDTRLGVVEATRTMTAVINPGCTSTASWMTLVENGPAPDQDCTAVFTAGLFSAPPVCFGASNGVNGGTPAYARMVVVAGTPSSSKARFQHVYVNTNIAAPNGGLDNEPFSIVCIGPK